MRTLLIAKGLHPPWATGAVSYAKGVLASLLLIPDNEVSVISTLENHRLSNARQDDWSQVRTFEECSISYLRLKGFSERELKTKVFAATKLLDSSEHFDIVHIVYQGLTPFEIKMGNYMPRKTPLVKHIYGPAPSYLSASTTNLIYNAWFLVSRRNSILSFPSCYSASTYWMHLNSHCLLIPPAVDTQVFAPQPGSSPDSFLPFLNSTPKKFGIENLAGKSKIILYIGWLIPQRFPYQLILRAFEKMLTAFLSRDTFLLIIGRQSEASYGEQITAENIINLAKRIGIEKNVGLALEELSEVDKINLINSSDILLYPFTTSRLKPQVVDPPLGILEAMACERTTLTSHVLSIPEVIKTGSNGFVLSNFAIDTISTSLTVAIQADTKIGKNARETIMRKFSVPAISGILSKMPNFA